MAGAAGATVHIHYCMGKVMGAGFGHKDEEKCGKCGMKKSISNGCCKDEHKTVKASDHQLAKASFDLSYTQIDIHPLPVYTAYKCLFHSGSSNNIAHANSPPSVWRTCPIYIRVQHFRI